MSTRSHIRPLAPEDYSAVARIFFCAVHEGTRNAYSYQQRLAWGGEEIDLNRWKARVEALGGFVAETDDEPIGFITIDQTGYVDLAFVLPSANGRGVGRTLLNTAEDWANCSIPDDQIDPRRSAFFMARSVLRDIRNGGRPC